MRRREFIAGLGGAVAWPMAPRAQQRALPVIGFLSSGVPFVLPTAFHQGLRELGFIEGQNLAFEYRWAEDQRDRLPALANDLVRRRVAVIFTVALPATLAAKAATQAVPIVFFAGADPVESGLVASLARPGGNITGVTILAGEVALKRLALLRELVPAATTIAYLVNRANPGYTEAGLRELPEAVSHLGVRLLILEAANPSEIELAFATLAEQRVGALLVGADPFFLAQGAQIVALAARYRVPASYWRREFIETGGLTSYSASPGDALRLAGAYVGRVLKGEKPADLPVQQPTKFDLIINLKTAKTLGLVVPPNLLALADEVIE